MNGKVALLIGSESDKKTVEASRKYFDYFDIELDLRVMSAHRNPDRVQKLAKQFEEECDVVIAGAGMAAHLPGVMAALVTIPVIGVPINASMDGLDSLLAIVQMPPGIPGATVAINGAKNAALLATQIIARYNKEVQISFLNFRKKQSEG